MKQFSLNVAPRVGAGRGASRRVRQSGRVPAVVYGKIHEPKAVTVDAPELTRLLKGIAGSAAIIELQETGTAARLSIIQEIQRDAITDQILHVDLHEVGANEELEVEITVHPTGDCIGVRVENGILETVSHRVRVRCLPKDLPAFIEVDVTELHVNESLHLSQLPVIAGVKYIGDPNQPILACVEPVVEAEPTPVAGAPVEGAAAAAPAAGAAAAPAADAKGAAAPAKGAAAAPAKGAVAAPAKAAPAKKSFLIPARRLGVAPLGSLRMSIRLIAGLGNPGREYADTRHNIGFLVVDAFVSARGKCWAHRREFTGDVARLGGGAGEELHALRPRTFMNESGLALGAFCRYHRITPAEVVVVYDELNLPFGRTKLSITGSAGGHNGIASLLQHFGDGFCRFRIGVGPRHPPTIDLKDYVLGKLTPEQTHIFQQNLSEYLAGLDLLLTQGVAPAMNRLNRKNSSDDGNNAT